MIAKPFEPSPFKVGIQALIRRLPQVHPYLERLQRELKNQDAGDQGEQYIFDLLQRIKLPSDARILHNITLNSFTEIQMDIVLITNHYALILEVKNIKGEIHFTKNPRQLIRIQENGQKDIFTSPEIQLEQAIDGFSDLINAYARNIPIYAVIVFAYNNAKIMTPPEKFPVIMSSELPNFIKKMPKNNRPSEATDIAEILLKHHTNKTPYPLCTYYQIEPIQLITGVHCPACAMPNMTRIKRTWRCPKCNSISTTAHYQALKEYGMLISPLISNKECREFLNLRNASEAKRILKNASNHKTGIGRATKYTLL